MYNQMKLLTLPGLFLASSVFATPIQKNFSVWQVTCNNQNLCTTRNTGAHYGLVMTLSQKNDVPVNKNLRIDLAINTGHDRSPANLSVLLVDNKPLILDDGHWQRTRQYLTTSDKAEIDAVLSKIVDAHVITRVNGPGKIVLHGLKAALQFIDSQQKWQRDGADKLLKKRLVASFTDTDTSLNHRALSSAPLTRDETNNLLDYGIWRVESSQCSLNPAKRDMRVFALSDDKALVIIGCEAGAYNMIDLAWIVSRHKPFAVKPVRLFLPFVPASGKSALELMNTQYDEEHKELTIFNKGRSFGDCGSISRWRFDGQGFRLVRYAEESACDDWHRHDAWPTLWVEN